MKILLVEDEERIASFLTKGLRAEGYAVEHVLTGTEALARARRQELDLVVLDLGLPDVDGTGVLRLLRQAGNLVPVIVLTARDDVRDRVKSLDLGADDYLTKPFAFPELVARVRARLRRRDGESGGVVSGAGLSLDLTTRRATVNGRAHDLTAREFTLLETFLRHPGQVLTRQRLLSYVWNMNFDPRSNIVDVYIGYLRRKLGEDVIETVRGRGYRLGASDRA